MPVEQRNKKWRAWILAGGRGSKKLSHSFSTKAAALQWERDMKSAKAKGLLIADPSQATVRQAAADLIAGMQSGAVMNRSGKTYRPNVVQQYEDLFKNHILPVIGDMKLVDVKRKDLQALVTGLLANAKGYKASTVRNVLKPLQVLFRIALRDELISVNPTTGLTLPRGTGTRDRVVSPQEVVELIAALKPEDRALWGTAFYAGLRRGEIAALRWSDIDFTKGVINVTRGYDWRNREFQDVKTDAGKRSVPLLKILRELLSDHKEIKGAEGLIFGATPERPFRDTNIRKRSLTAWNNAKLEPITLQDARRHFAAILISSGASLKAVETYMGHADIATTMKAYAHLLPGAEAQDAARLDDFLAATA